jgi:hypothetical protein
MVGGAVLELRILIQEAREDSRRAERTRRGLDGFESLTASKYAALVGAAQRTC